MLGSRTSKTQEIDLRACFLPNLFALYICRSATSFILISTPEPFVQQNKSSSIRPGD